MSDEQKVYYGFVCLEEILEDRVVKVIGGLEDFEIVEVEDPRGGLSDLGKFLERPIKEEKLIEEKPLWVIQQENKKLRRK